MSEEDGICYFCNKLTQIYAGDPGEWPLGFCYNDNSGVTKIFHVGCVQEKLEEGEKLKENLSELVGMCETLETFYKTFLAWKLIKMSEKLKEIREQYNMPRSK